MKTKITMAGAFLASFLFPHAMQAQNDLAIGNISAGWNTYNSGTGVITGVYFDVLNNENSNPGSFGIEVYLVDPNDANVNFVVWSYTDGDGQNGNTVVTYDNIDIDFNTTPGIPGGQYRLAVCVDPAEDVSENNENNNCLYISSQGDNLTYAPNTAGINDEGMDAVSLYPNPTTDMIHIARKKGWENAMISISDISGKELKTAVLNAETVQIDLSDLSNGLYIYRLIDQTGVPLATGKIIKK